MTAALLLVETVSFKHSPDTFAVQATCQASFTQLNSQLIMSYSTLYKIRITVPFLLIGSVSLSAVITQLYQRNKNSNYFSKYFLFVLPLTNCCLIGFLRQGFAAYALLA